MQENYFTKETLKAALEAKGITTNDQAKPVIDAMIKKGAIIQGINEPVKEPSLVSKLADTGKATIGSINETGGRVASGQTDPLSGTVQMVGNVAKGGLDAVGNVISSTPVVKDVVSAVTKPVSEGLKITQNWLENNPTFKDAANSGIADSLASFFDAHPDIARNADAVNNIANAALMAKGGIESASKAGELAKIGAVAVKDGVNSAGTSIADTVGGVTKKVSTVVKPTSVQAVANTEKGIMNIVDNSKSLVKDFAKREGTGKNPVKMIAENPDYSVKVNPESKTIDATDAITNMKRDISSFSQVRDNLLKVADESLPPIKTNDILNKTLDVFSNKNYATYLDEGEKAVAGIIKKLKTLQKYNPDTVSRTTLNDIRKGLDDTINSFTDTKLQDKVRLDLRKVFQTTLEDSIPESGLLKTLNAQIGDIIDASEFTAKKLNGSKVKGGGLTDLAMKATGVATGAAVGGGMLGGIPAAVGGYMLANFISKNLIKNAINNPFDRKVLEQLKQARPEIIKQTEDYINSLTSQNSLIK